MPDSAQPRLSLEFFPPKTPRGREKLRQVRRELTALSPAFCSVTYGAGGSTRDATADVVEEFHSDGLRVAPHLSFGGQGEDVVLQLLERYRERGIDQLVALRGDLPSGMGGTSQLVHADQLVHFIRKQCGQHFHIDVAAYPEIHPEATSYDSDIGFLKAKFDAGANSAITQFFYNVDAYLYFVDRCRSMGIDQPIYPGIMPIINFTSLKRFAANCGAEIPRWICQRMESLADDEEGSREFALDAVAGLCQSLLERGAPGLHFYTMNQTEPTRSIWHRLKH